MRGEAFEQALRAHAMPREPPLDEQIRSLQGRLEQPGGVQRQTRSSSQEKQQQQQQQRNSAIPELSLADMEKEFRSRQESQPLTVRPRTAAASPSPMQPAPPTSREATHGHSRQRPRTAPNPNPSYGNQGEDQGFARDVQRDVGTYEVSQPEPSHEVFNSNPNLTLPFSTLETLRSFRDKAYL